MPEASVSRVAVYIDFDNIVISRYDQVHGRGSYMREKPEAITGAAVVEIGAIIDFAASFGTLVLTRAYADWSSPVNADYRRQLVARAVDLVQLFPAAAYAKNGADIRLAVDAVEDMFRLPDLTHVVIVAGDSDYIALAQRCRRLGRYVVGVGVAGSTAKSLAAACDEFDTYDSLPGVPPLEEPLAPPVAKKTGTRRRATKATDASATDAAATDAAAAESAATDAGPVDPAGVPLFSAPEIPASRARARSVDDSIGDPADDPQDAATRLLERALRLGHDKDDADWLHSSAVKEHMRRMDPSFSEKALGYRSFSDFVKARGDVAELEETGHERLVRLAAGR